MVKLGKVKLSASTLIETIVSLVIIVSITGMTLTFFINITQTGYSLEKIKAQSIGEKVLIDNETSCEVGIDSFRVDNMLVVNEVSEDSEIGALFRVHVEVFSENKKLLFRQTAKILQNEKD